MDLILGTYPGEGVKEKLGMSWGHRAMEGAARR